MTRVRFLHGLPDSTWIHSDVKIEFPSPTQTVELWEHTLMTYFMINFSFRLGGVDYFGEVPRLINPAGIWKPDGSNTIYEVDWPPPDVDTPAVIRL